MKLSHRTPDPWADPAPSLAAKLAAFFHCHPNQWIDGRTLAQIAGYAAWRTRCSDLRKPPFRMQIDNRQRRVEADGRTFTVSEYRFAVVERTTGKGAAAGAEDANHSV